MSDYYGILGVDRLASDEEIKKAYKKLALKHHPDRGGDVQTFQQIGEAYNVLSDPQKKNIYDVQGKDGLKEFDAQESQQGSNPFDVFQSMFGGGFPGMSNRRDKKYKEIELSLSLEEIYTGKSKTIDIKRRVIDQTKVHKCTTCQGRGCQVRVSTMGGNMFQQQLVPCTLCKGQGHSIADDAVTIVEEKIIVTVPPGCSEGTRIVITGKMDEEPGEPAGDLVFVVQYRKQAVFRAVGGGDLEMDMNINLYESLTGFTRIVRHPDGTFLTITHEGIILPNSKWSIPGEGIVKNGNLHCIVKVEYPTKVSENKTELTHILHQKKIIQRISSTDVTVRNVKLSPYIQRPVKNNQNFFPRERHGEQASECHQQ